MSLFSQEISWGLMPGTDFGGVDHRLEWADFHIHQLETQLRWFAQHYPYRILIERTRDGTNKVFRDPKPIPHQIPLRIGDVVHSLRCALDHLACLAVEAATGMAPPGSAFPIWRCGDAPSPAEYESFVLAQLGGVGKDVVEFLLGLEPYFGGIHEPLRVVDYLDMVDKHREPLVAFFCGRSATPTNVHDDKGLPPSVDSPGQGALLPPLKDGDVLEHQPAHALEAGNAEVVVEVALAEPPVIHGKAPVPALIQLSSCVKQVVDDFRSLL
jgi:hypothetical protein